MEVQKKNRKKNRNSPFLRKWKMYTFVHYFKLQTSISIQSKDFANVFTLQSCLLLTLATASNLLQS